MQESYRKDDKKEPEEYANTNKNDNVNINESDK